MGNICIHIHTDVDQAKLREDKEAKKPPKVGPMIRLWNFNEINQITTGDVYTQFFNYRINMHRLWRYTQYWLTH